MVKLDPATIMSIVSIVLLALNYFKLNKEQNKSEDIDMAKIEKFANENSATNGIEYNVKNAVLQPFNVDNIHENPNSHKNQIIVHKEIVLQIKSWERDINIYPEPQMYTVELNNPIYNVESIELVRASIPRGEYVVNDYNKYMEVLDISTNTVIEIEMTIGNYNILQYCDQLTTMFSSTILPLVFTFNPGVTPPSTTEIEISGSKEFTILNGSGWRRESANFPELGLFPVDVTATQKTVGANFTVVGKRVDIGGARYIDIDIEELGLWSANNIQPNNTLASVALDTQSAITIFEPNNTGPKRNFNPHAVVSKLTLKFYDNTPYKKRRLYNFQGLEHTITLAFNVMTYQGEIPPLTNTI